MVRTRWSKFGIIFGAIAGLAYGQPALIAPTACDALVMTPPDEAGQWMTFDIANGSDATLKVFRSIAGGKRKETATGILAPRYAERFWGKPGTVFIIEDTSGKCIAGYTVGKQHAQVKIGDKDIRVRQNVPPNRLKMVIFPGFSIKPDRNEPFVDSQGVNSTMCEALYLWIGARTAQACGGPRKAIDSDRYIEIDLSRPVAGARPLGVIRENKAEIHVFLDHDHERRTIRNIQELEPGEQSESERTEFGLSVNGVHHTLLVGPWGPGEFGTRQKKQIHGEGTTKAFVKRVSSTIWEVFTADNATGRLWHNEDTANPIDRGLYRLSFHFRFELLPEQR
jgi:hypothetical protein